MLSEEQWIVAAYLLLLGREPESRSAILGHRRTPFDLAVLRDTLLASHEFAGSRPPPAPAVDPDLLPLKSAFAASPMSGQPGYFIDFLGTRTRCAYLPEHYRDLSGTVETIHGGGAHLHEDAETLAFLRSARDANGMLTVVELGAGWGPWLIAGAAAARTRGLGVRLIGVEASVDHMAFLKSHFEDNGIDPDAHRLVLAAVGGSDGISRFPVLPHPSEDWGASVQHGDTGRETIEVTRVSLATLLDDIDRVDLLHCDVQGAEGEALAAAIDILDRKVGRIVVGTHGRAIEEALHTLFAGHGWFAEHDTACRFLQVDDGMALIADGTQVWRNRSFAETDRG